MPLLYALNVKRKWCFRLYEGLQSSESPRGRGSYRVRCRRFQRHVVKVLNEAGAGYGYDKEIQQGQGQSGAGQYLVA